MGFEPTGQGKYSTKGGGIISNLQNFPLVNQNTTITSDGRPSENAPFDCVAASIGAAILWYQGKSQWDQNINPDKLKDAAYGENWKNQGTAASAYVAYVATLGYKLYSINGLVGQLPGLAHEYLAKNLPVIFTERDPYVPASYGWSHVCAWYSDLPGQLTALDPYIGRPITRSDQEWVTELIGNELWIVEKIQGGTMGVPTGWKDDGTTLTAPNGVPVVLGFRSYVLANNWDPNNLPVVAQYYISQLEVSNPALGPGDQQPFYDTLLGYPHAPQAPWEGLKGKVIVEYVGKELVAVSHQVSLCVAQIKQLQAQLAAQPPSQNPQAGQALVDMQQIKAIAGKY